MPIILNYSKKLQRKNCFQSHFMNLHLPDTNTKDITKKKKKKGKLQANVSLTNTDAKCPQPNINKLNLTIH